MNYYNENDPKAAAWLRQLIAHGHIAHGTVDTRSIVDVQPGDLHGYTQCHFFAGIGGWSYALRLAGWPDERPAWTGSCPCQPLSCAGLGKGHADERHLWPAFQRLIAQRQPPAVFGEQVASKDGREWLAGIRADLEAMGYALGAADLCAAGIGAPHIRQRLYWVAHPQHAQRRAEHQEHAAAHGRNGPGGSGEPRGLADAELSERRPLLPRHELDRNDARRHEAPSGTGARSEDGRLEHPESDGWQQRRPEPIGRSTPSGCSPGGLADTAIHRREQSPEMPQGRQSEPAERCGAICAAWSHFDLIPCADGKSRRIESGTFPLAHGVPGRVGLLRGYGNAIVPQVASAFVQAYLEVVN